MTTSNNHLLHCLFTDETIWMSLIKHVGLEMNVIQLKQSSPGDILLTILKEWNAHMKAVTVRHFCDVCNELGILEVEQYMKKVELGAKEEEDVKDTGQGVKEAGQGVKEVWQRVKSWVGRRQGKM